MTGTHCIKDELTRRLGTPGGGPTAEQGGRVVYGPGGGCLVVGAGRGAAPIIAAVVGKGGGDLGTPWSLVAAVAVTRVGSTMVLPGGVSANL